ncbi:pre-mRNA-splicing factor 8, partial [Perkinsus olseni]
WNYNFMGIKHKADMEYKLVVDNPIDFYHEFHRRSHHLNFAESLAPSSNSLAADQREGTTIADREDVLA